MAKKKQKVEVKAEEKVEEAPVPTTEMMSWMEMMDHIEKNKEKVVEDSLHRIKTNVAVYSREHHSKLWIRNPPCAR